MFKRPLSSRRIATSLLALLTPFTAPLFAGDAHFSNDKQPTVQQTAQEANTENLFDMDSTYDFGADFHKGKGAFGKQDAIDTSVQVGHRFPLNSLKWPNTGGQWFLRLGASYDRYDFGSSKAPVPDQLQNFNAEIALEYLVDNQAEAFIQTHPGFYFSKSVTGPAFDIPTDIGGGFVIIHGKLFGFVGVTGSIMRSNVPVLPFGGIQWNINSKLTLRAVLPEPRLVYNVTNNFAVWAGGQVTGGSFKTDINDGVTPKRLSGAVVNYSEYRAGGGLTYSIKPVTLEMSGGYTFTRDFDFPRADLNYSTKGAPYIRLSAHIDF